MQQIFTRPKCQGYATLLLLIGLSFSGRATWAQTISPSERKAIGKIFAQKLEHNDSVARLRHTKTGILSMNKIYPATPHSSLFIADAVNSPLEQLPTLPTGSGVAGLVESIEQQCIKTSGVNSASEGFVFVTFTVNANGTVQEAKVIEGGNPLLNKAIIAAVYQLPVLTPGQSYGKTYPVSLTVPIHLKS